MNMKMDEEELTDKQKVALARREWERQQIRNVIDGPVSYLMSKLTFANVLKLADANMEFSMPCWSDEMYRRLGWKNVRYGELTIMADMNGHTVCVSNQCKSEGVFAIRYGGKTELKAVQDLIGQVINIEVLTSAEFVKLLSPDTSLIATDQIKSFHVCKCHGDKTPLSKQCMCHWCHTCDGVKPEYAEQYRNSEWYKEV